MEAAARRHDIDWLRVIAIGLLIVYHIAIAFQPWGIFIGFIQNEDSLEGLWPAMAMMNVWRIPLLFYVSGMGVSFAMRKRNWLQLITERSRRILIPFLFGMAAIVPLHRLLWQLYYKQDLQYEFQVGHLWFLGNIFVYVLLLSPLFILLKRGKASGLRRALNNLLGSPLSLLVIAAIFIGEALLLKPESFELYVLTPHGFFLGLLAFFFGFLCTEFGEGFWPMLRKWKWLLLGLATGLYVSRLFDDEQAAPLILKSLESNAWIFGLFGLASTYLNTPGKTLKYLSGAAYPVYIFHMIFLYLGAYFLFPTGLPASLKLIILVLFTTAGCFGAYELMRRIPYLRILFGLKA
jgi:glucan biosynthesis protein C